jgi:hypothetical protein
MSWRARLFLQSAIVCGSAWNCFSNFHFQFAQDNSSSQTSVISADLISLHTVFPIKKYLHYQNDFGRIQFNDRPESLNAYFFRQLNINE